jgi:hypothetical protein
MSWLKGDDMWKKVERNGERTALMAFYVAHVHNAAMDRCSPNLTRVNTKILCRVQLTVTAALLKAVKHDVA